MRRLLRRLNRRYGQLNSHPRDKLLAIAQAEEVSVVPVHYGREGQSMLLDDSGRWRILVNADMPETRQTWSLAHELGHYFLHRADGGIFYDSGTEHSTQERAANRFAARLLMPRSFMASLVTAETWATDIARQLGLSSEAVTYRLMALHLLTPDVRWFLEDVPF